MRCDTFGVGDAAAIDVPSISLHFSTDVLGSSSRQQQQQHLDQKIKMNTYEAIHQPTMTSPRPKNKDEHVFCYNLFINFSSMHRSLKDRNRSSQ